MDALDRIARFFERRKRRIVKRTSAEALDWGWIHLLGLRAWERQIFFSETSSNRSFSSRDEGMA